MISTSGIEARMMGIFLAEGDSRRVAFRNHIAQKLFMPHFSFSALTI